MKYKLLKETKKINGRVLYQIESLQNFEDVKKGDKGGWIEDESNLSQSGKAWVSGNAQVFENAIVYGDAEVSGDEEVK